MVRFTEVVISTASADAMACFWRQLGFTPVIQLERSQLPLSRISDSVKSNNSDFREEGVGLMASTVTISVGRTRLKFQELADGSQDYGHYHYAFNIPEHRFEEGKAWLSGKVALMKMEVENPLALAEIGSTTVFFDKWDAHSCYFRDADGNIAELIARHVLKEQDVEVSSALPFSYAHLQCVSEVAVASTDVLATVAELSTLSSNLQPFLSSTIQPNQFFCAVGDDEGLIIVMNAGRAMLPTPDYTAEDRPACLKIDGGSKVGQGTPAFQSCSAGVSKLVVSSESHVHQQVSEALSQRTATVNLQQLANVDEGSGFRSKRVMLNHLRVALEWE